MKRLVTDVGNNLVEVECIGCAIAQNLIEVRGGIVLQNSSFIVSQDFEVPIPGFMILATKRHINSIDEFTDEETREFIDLLQQTRKLQREIMDVESVYIHQEEDSSDHFHVWMLPRYPWMHEKFGDKIESVRPIMEYAKKELKTSDNLKLLDKSLEQCKLAISKQV